MAQVRIIFTALLLLLSPLVNADKPQRIVSLGLCTDQLLLMLAEREQIASVSRWARNRNLSYMFDSVGNIPLNNTSLEEIVGFDPDLVIASEFVARDTIRILRRMGYPVRQLPVVTSIEQIYELLTQFGSWTGNEARADALVSGMRRQLLEIRERYASRPIKRALVYSPNGYTIGAATLEHDLLVHAGYRNLAAEMGINGFRSISLEQVVIADPDVLQIDRNQAQQHSLAAAYLEHPLLQTLIRQREVFDIPTRLRICAGPMIVEAVAQMAARR